MIEPTHDHRRLFFQFERIPAPIVDESKQNREEDLPGTQETHGGLGNRLQSPLCQVGQRSADLRSPLFPRQGKITRAFIYIFIISGLYF